MEFDPSDSSGTDDDLPPSHQNRGIRGGRVTGNGRTVGSYPRVPNDMEAQIHQLEQEAYCSVLRAFKAQSDAITWEKEGLITELRKELRVSDEEHRELLSRVNADDIIRRIREWRQAGGGFQSGLLNTSQPMHDPVPSPTVSASRKRQKTTQALPSSSLGAPSSAMHSQQVAPSMQLSLSAAKRAPAAGSKSKNPKSGQTLPRVSSVKSMQYTSTGPNGRGQPSEAAAFDPLIGRKVMTRWPEDNNFYEAVITDYNSREGLHALVYDINTKNETWEWVNLSEISPEDIQWEGEDPGILHRVGHGGPGRGNKKSTGPSGTIPGAGRGRDSVIKEVERIFGTSHPDPLEMEKARKLLKDHEQSLIDVLSRLADASDGESEEGEQFSHGQLMDQNQGWKNRQHGGSNQQGANYADGVIGRGREGEGSDGDPMDYREAQEYAI
ncbi:hypothetical protein J5N97_000737 [Dioscorea zingiberensis]|uniref:ENT domain-containing protein n=1 Tax=Dioscorea zingiberensis TaxID=325984 RepID=A0A9D5H2Y1_9LILI|nr:hypothetical protein J5N97_000737 [Dioscorea zingiberensis]